MSEGKVIAKIIHLGVGVDLLGSKTSLSTQRGNELEVTPLGVIASSAKTGRKVLIPWANIRGCELFSEDQPLIEAKDLKLKKAK